MTWVRPFTYRNVTHDWGTHYLLFQAIDSGKTTQPSYAIKMGNSHNKDLTSE